jgi:hypothetical protein
MFEANVAGECLGGAICYDGPPQTIPMTDCTFIKPTNTSAGHNDIRLTSAGSDLAFYCPEGTTGKPAAITPSTSSACWNQTINVADLPPSKKVVHCTPSPKTCTGHPPACNCTGASANLSIADCTAWQKIFDAMFDKEPWTRCDRQDPCYSGGDPGPACENDTITFFGYAAAAQPGGRDLLPSEIGLLTNLKTLIYVGITGITQKAIPTEIGRLSHLQSLDLRGGFTGTIPCEITGLSKLTSLSLSPNLLTGRVPELPFAQYTSDCMIQPSKYCLSGNNFTCPLPAHAQQCTYGKDNLAGVECFVPAPEPPPASCSLDFDVTETDFASASCSGTPGYKNTFKSGRCTPNDESERFCCNHDGSVIAYAYFSDTYCSCTVVDAWNQTSGKCKKLSDTSSQLFTCVKTSQLP